MAALAQLPRRHHIGELSAQHARREEVRLLVGEQHPDGHPAGDVVEPERRHPPAGRLRVQPHRAGDAVGDPVDHDVVQEVVQLVRSGQAAVREGDAVHVRPAGELLQDVGSQAGRGVAQRDAHRVRFGGLEVSVAGLPRQEGHEVADGVEALLEELGADEAGEDAADGEHQPHPRRAAARGDHVQVETCGGGHGHGSLWGAGARLTRGHL